MKRFVLALLMLISCTVVASAQNSRQYIKGEISKWGVCRNVAITDTGGDIALNYKNQYAYSSIPQSLANAIIELHDDGEFIDDIQLTEGGRWLVLYGDNGLRWNGIPSRLESKLREFNRNQEVITSVTFNDSGDWIVVTTEHIAASDDIYDWIREGISDYGQLWAAHLTEDGLALCFEEGFKFTGNVPYKLKDALQKATFNVYRIKFTQNGHYFFADKDGNYNYFM